MANYTFFLSDGVTEVTVNDSVINNQYTVPLLGQNVTSFGDDVALGALRHLENFSAPDSPDTNININGAGSSVLKGQLWFDSSTSTIKVNVGTTATPSWQEMAGLASGSVSNSAARWSGSAWVEEERVQITDLGALSIHDVSLANYITMQHSSGDLVINNANGTDNIVIENFNGNMTLRDDMELWVSGGVGNSQSIELVPDDGDFNSRIRTVGTDRMDIGGSINALNLEGALFLEQRASAFTDAATFGQVYVKTSDGGLYYKYNATGEVRLDVTAGGTVTGSGSNNQLAVWSGTSSLDGSANFTFDGTTAQFTSSTFGQFVIDRASFLGAGIRFQNDNGIKGYVGFDDSNNFRTYNNAAAETGFIVGSTGIITANGLTLGDNDNLIFGNGSDVVIDFNGTNLIVDGTGATKIDIVGTDMVFTEPYQIRFEADASYGGQAILHKQLSGTPGNVGGGMHWQDESNYFHALMSYQGINNLTGGNPGGTIGLLNIVGNDEVIIYMNSGLDAELWMDQGVSMYHLDVNSLGTQRIIASSNVTSGAYVRRYDGGLEDVGYNVMPISTLPPGSTRTLSNDYVSYYLNTDGILASSTVATSDNLYIPVGATFVVAHDGSVGTVTIQQTAPTTLKWLNGSGTILTGNRTLSLGGVCTIMKSTGAPNSDWVIWGSGLS